MDNDQTLRYIQDLFAREDDALIAARRRHDSEDLPVIHISPDEGKLIAVLLSAVGARRVLEIGTLGGYSGIWIARALLPGGRLTTIESEPRHARIAREAFQEAGVAEVVEVVEGNALDVLAGFTAEYDVVFVDADKEPLESYYHHSMRLLRVGGLLLCDNAIFHHRVIDLDDQSADIVGVRTFNRLAAEDPRLTATIIPVRDGLLAGVKISA